MNWFSYHLSNFQYVWSWAEWTDFVSVNPNLPFSFTFQLNSFDKRRIFIKEVLEKCLHLSYHDRLVKLLPEEYAPLIPEVPAISYALSEPDHPAFEQAKLFQEMVQSRKTSAEVLLELQTDRLASAESVRFDQDLVSVFTSVLLSMANKTFSHTFAAFTK